MKTWQFLTIAAFFAAQTVRLSAVTAQGRVKVAEAFPSLLFEQPVGLEPVKDGSERLLIVEQAGLIKEISAAGTVELFLDISSRVISGGERGLLGLALHPQFSSNGLFFVNYTRQPDGATVVARYRALQGAAASPDSEESLLLIPQPFSNHNGGQLAFGPDGFLYIALGDGGSGGDPMGNAQNKASLLGKILRIDVNSRREELNYAIPPDNPYRGNGAGYREEIFAYGFRNPWRFSFDSLTGRLWAGDVGQENWEEIDIVRKGGNYGWNILEGRHCYPPPLSRCRRKGLRHPIAEYSHAKGSSIIGGFVYRGRTIPSLRGSYIFGDLTAKKIWMLKGRRIVTIATFPAALSAFGVGQQGELYLLGYDSGKIYSILPREALTR